MYFFSFKKPFLSCRERGKQAWRKKDLCKIAGSTEGREGEQEE